MRRHFSRSRLFAVVCAAAGVAVWLTFYPPRWWLNLTKPVDLADAVGAGRTLIKNYACR